MIISICKGVVVRTSQT